MNQKKETLEKEKESLNKSDAVALKGREAQLTKELEAHDKILADKSHFWLQRKHSTEMSQTRSKRKKTESMKRKRSRDSVRRYA